MLGVFGQGLGWQKFGVELGFSDFNPNFIPTGDVSNFFPDFDMPNAIFLDF